MVRTPPPAFGATPATRLHGARIVLVLGMLAALAFAAWVWVFHKGTGATKVATESGVNPGWTAAQIAKFEAILETSVVEDLRSQGGAPVQDGVLILTPEIAAQLERVRRDFEKQVRETFGDAMTLYADANSSYDVPKAIEIGRLMEKYKYGFFEEPVPFDHLDDTKQVADALTIPVAGGEQEFSLWGFRWMIHHRAVDIVQPDLHYFGGYIRCLRVARMAAEAGMPCTLHMGGTGLGYLDALHFMACIPNALEYQEYKGPSGLPITCATSSLVPKEGVVRVPSGPGFGYTLDPEFVRQAVPVRTT